MHHSGGTVCEPVDVPVNKRHLDMVYSHIRYSDKPFMGSVTAPERARDTVEMARIVFGAEFVDRHAVVLSLINANSPLVWDATMVGAARAYAEANQATLMTPVHPGRRDGPGDGRRGVRPDPGRGARRHDLRAACPAGRPGRARLVRQLDVDAVGRADLRHARAGPRAVRDGRPGPPAGRAVPLGRQPVRLQAARCPGGLRVGRDPPADRPGRRQLRAPRRRLAGRRPGHAATRSSSWTPTSAA